MKKSVLFFAILFVWLSASAVGLGECVYEGFRYSLQDNGSCTLTAPAGSRAEVTGEIVIPSTVSHNGKSYRVTAIGQRAFYKCLNLTSVKIQPTSIVIGYSAFEGCKNLESVSGTTPTVIYPKAYAFMGCSNLSEITGIEFNVNRYNLDLSYVYDDGVFQNCSKLKTVVFTSNTNVVSTDFFKGCSELSDITLPSSVQAIGGSAFEGCSNLKSINLDNVTSIYDNAFAWSGLTSVNLPCVETLGSSPFLGCHDLRSAYIGDKLRECGNPFIQCINLTQITVSDANPNFLSRDNCLYEQRHDEDEYGSDHHYYLVTARADMETYKIPSDFNTFFDHFYIGNYSGNLSNCTKLTQIDNLPYDVKAYAGKILLPDDTSTYFLYQTYGPYKAQSLPFTYDGERLKTGLGYGGIIGSYTLESVTLDDDLAISSNGIYSPGKIGGFVYCTALKTVRIPNSPALEVLSGFDGCISLTSLEGGDNLQTIGGFNDCRSLVNFVFPPRLKRIEGFSNCVRLESVVFPEEVEAIGGFSGCNNLKAIKIPASVKSLSGFVDCQNLVTLSLPDGLESLRGFSSTSLNTVTIPGNCTAIEEAFNSCDNLETVEILEGVSQISRSFSFCDKLKSITLPNSMKTATGFNNCYGLESVKLGINVQSIGSTSNGNSSKFAATAFAYCPNLKRFVSNVKLEDFEGAFTGDYFDEFVIGPSAKKSCDIVNSAKKIYSTALTPPTIENSQKYDGNAELYIRSEAYNAYMSASPWKQFPAEKVHRLNEIKEVVLDVETVTANPGSSFKIAYTLKPADADLPYVYWQSSNPEIASVDDDGVVTFHQSQDSDQEKIGFAEYANERDNEDSICEIQAFTLYSTEPVAVLKIVSPSSSIEGTNEEIAVKTGDVYNLQGILIRKNATRDEIDQLPAGIYIYGGEKIRVD